MFYQFLYFFFGFDSYL